MRDQKISIRPQRVARIEGTHRHQGSLTGRYSDLDGHGPFYAHMSPQELLHIRIRGPSAPDRGPGVAEDLRSPRKCVGTWQGGYSPPQRGEDVRGGKCAPGPPPSSVTTMSSSVVTSVSGTVCEYSARFGTPARWCTVHFVSEVN